MQSPHISILSPTQLHHIPYTYPPRPHHVLTTSPFCFHHILATSTTCPHHIALYNLVMSLTCPYHIFYMSSPIPYMSASHPPHVPYTSSSAGYKLWGHSANHCATMSPHSVKQEVVKQFHVIVIVCLSGDGVLLSHMWDSCVWGVQQWWPRPTHDRNSGQSFTPAAVKLRQEQVRSSHLLFHCTLSLSLCHMLWVDVVMEIR